MIAPFFFSFWLSPVSDDYRFEVVGILWSYVQWSDHGNTGSGFLIFDTLSVAIAFLLSIFRFVFVIAIRKHQKGLVRQRTVWISAVLSQIPMSVFLFSPFFMSGLVGPIPILLVIGLIIDRRIGVEPATTPWNIEPLETKNG
ncbi:MAG: hypothetical protein E3J86_05760 [Candidatus Thorarchaeota archaeon]|nr:MAG: hypothetical protein E3J86_05760 [Candidatus Thorarchaeota archaeon]